MMMERGMRSIFVGGFLGFGVWGDMGSISLQGFQAAAKRFTHKSQNAP